MKYLTYEYTLNWFNVDWHPDFLNVKVFKDSDNHLLKNAYIIQENDEEGLMFFIAKPSRAFVDIFLTKGWFKKEDLLGRIEREFELTSEITSEMLEMLYSLYQHSSKDKKILTFEKNDNNFKEFKNQLGVTFNKFYSPEIITFEKSLNH